MCRCLFHCLLTWASSDSSFQPLPLSFSEKMLVRKKRCMRRHESNQQWNGSNFCSPNPALPGPTTSAVPPPVVLSFPLAFFLLLTLLTYYPGYCCLSWLECLRHGHLLLIKAVLISPPLRTLLRTKRCWGGSVMFPRALFVCWRGNRLFVAQAEAATFTDWQQSRSKVRALGLLRRYSILINHFRANNAE